MRESGLRFFLIQNSVGLFVESLANPVLEVVADSAGRLLPAISLLVGGPEVGELMQRRTAVFFRPARPRSFAPSRHLNFCIGLFHAGTIAENSLIIHTIFY